MKERFRQFSNSEFLNLETYKRRGRPVRTPMWFAHNGERLFVRTADDSGKVKRVRNNPVVRIAPCDSRGTLLGEWVEGTARLASNDETILADKLLGQKYGKLKSDFDAISALRGTMWAVLVVEVDGSSSSEGVR